MLIKINKKYNMKIRNMYGQGEVETQVLNDLTGEDVLDIISKLLEVELLEEISFLDTMIYVSTLDGPNGEKEYSRITIEEVKKYAKK